MNVTKEGLFLDTERAGIGGLASTSRAAMIGSVLLVASACSEGSEGSTITGVRSAGIKLRLLGLIGVVVTTDAGLCGRETIGVGSFDVDGL